MAENLLWYFLHQVQIQQYKAIKTLLLDRASVFIRMILNLLADKVSCIS